MHTVAHSKTFLNLQIHFKTCMCFYLVCLCLLVVPYGIHRNQYWHSVKYKVLKTLYMCNREEKNMCIGFLCRHSVSGDFHPFLNCSVLWCDPTRHCVVLCVSVSLFVSHVCRQKGLMLHGQTPVIVVQSCWLYPDTQSSITVTYMHRWPQVCPIQAHSFNSLSVPECSH